MQKDSTVNLYKSIVEKEFNELRNEANHVSEITSEYFTAFARDVGCNTHSIAMIDELYADAEDAYNARVAALDARFGKIRSKRLDHITKVLDCLSSLDVQRSNLKDVVPHVGAVLKHFSDLSITVSDIDKKIAEIDKKQTDINNVLCEFFADDLDALSRKFTPHATATTRNSTMKLRNLPSTLQTRIKAAVCTTTQLPNPDPQQDMDSYYTILQPVQSQRGDQEQSAPIDCPDLCVQGDLQIATAARWIYSK